MAPSNVSNLQFNFFHRDWSFEEPSSVLNVGLPLLYSSTSTGQPVQVGADLDIGLSLCDKIINHKM